MGEKRVELKCLIERLKAEASATAEPKDSEEDSKESTDDKESTLLTQEHTAGNFSV